MAPVSKVNGPMAIGMSERSVAMNVHLATYPCCFNRHLDRPQQRVIGLFRIWFDGGLPNVFGKKPNPVSAGRTSEIYLTPLACKGITTPIVSSVQFAEVQQKGMPSRQSGESTTSKSIT